METQIDNTTDTDLLQTAMAEREELALLRRSIDAQIMRLIFAPLEAIKAIELMELQQDLDRWAVLRGKYTVI